MITIRSGKNRGVTQIDWLQSHHSFSFGGYYDPAHMGFGPLRVINEDFVAPAGGFDTHGHKDMEIITYVLSGALAHRDSMGNGTTIQSGEVQKMSAGTGVEHSEFNASETEPVHFLQIWIKPDARGVSPNYGQIATENLARDENGLFKIASNQNIPGLIHVHQDMELFGARLNAGQSIVLPLKPARRYWLQLAKGAITLNGENLTAGDGAAIMDEKDLTIRASDPSDLLLFDLPA